MEPKIKGRTLSLVLGSGGARGCAHIGVIRCLEEEGYQIRSIAGSSMGAVIGGVYGIGKLGEFEEWMRAIRKMDIVSLMDISLTGGGLLRGDKIINTLKELFGDGLIEDMPIKFTAVAADIVEEKEVWINSGPVFDAIRASMSLPLILTPHERNGVALVDGGVLNPVPIAPTFHDDTDFTLAVSLGGVPEAPEPAAAENEKQRLTDEPKAVREKIAAYINSLMPSNSTPNAPSGQGVFAVADRSFDAMQSTIARQKLAAYPPDFLIEIARNRCGTMEFDRADELIELGYQKTRMLLGLSRGDEQSGV
jgi:NTE family protein